LTSASASFAVVSSSYAAASGSLSTRVTNLEATSSTVSQSFASTSGSISGRVTLIEGQYATTGSNNFTGPQFVNQASNAISFTSTASLYTDGGLRVAKDSFVSGTAYFNNITVYGTSSIEYITSSQVNIGSNVITVNTDTPAIRFGGISVFDSGSTQLTGSLFWDSEKNHWIYSNPSGSSYNSAMLMNGPRNTGSLGSEQGTTACYLMAGQGGDHITSSQIYTDSNATCFYGQSFISSSGAAYFNGCVGIGSLTSSGYRLEVTNPSCASGYANVFYGLHNANNTITIKQFGANHPTAAAANQIGVLNAEQHLYLVTDDMAAINAGTSTKGIFLKSGGNVGIGTQCPLDKLDVSGALRITGQLCINGVVANTTYIDQASGTSRLLSYGPNSTTRGAITFFQASSTNAFQFTGLTLDPSGNAIFEGCVGIKCSTPSYTLDVNGTGRFSGIAYFNQQINVGTSTLASNADVGLLTNTGNWYISNIQASHYFQIYDAQATAIRLLINTDGGLTLGGTNGAGIGALYAGSSTFSNVVSVSKASDSDYLALKIENRPITANNTSSGFIAFYQNPGNGSTNTISSGRIYGKFDTNSYASARLTFSTVTGFDEYQDVMTLKYGNVGIGTTTPGYKLDVQCGWINNVGAQNASGFRYENSGAGHTITLNANNSYAQLYTTTDTSLYLGANNNLTIKISNTGETCFKCNAYFCGSTYGIIGLGEKVFDKTCYVMTTTGTICLPLDGLGYGNGPTRAIYIYGSLLGNDSLQYAHMVYYYRNDYGGLQAATVAQASCAHPSTAGQIYTYTVNDPDGIGKQNCTLNLRLTSSGAGVAPGSYCTQMRIVVYNVPG
jgi:hypothetical protein